MSVRPLTLIMAFLAANLAATASAQYQYDSIVEGYGDGGSYCSDCGYGNGRRGGGGCEPLRHNWLHGLQGDGLWSFRGGALFMRRNAPSDATLLYAFDGIDITPSVDADVIDTNFETGWEASIHRKLHCDYSAEVRYFQIQDMYDRIDTRPDVGYGIITNRGTFFGLVGGGPVTAAVQYNSSIRSAEANLRGHIGRVQTIAGVRYIDLDEDLFMPITNGVSFNNFFYGAENDLYGFQLGLEVAVLPQHYLWQIDCYAKAGVYYNDFTIRNGNTSNLVASSANRLDDHTTSAVAEIGISTSYQLTYNLSITTGAQFLWLNNVVEPSDQILANGDPDLDGLTGFDDSGTPFFLGIYAGLEFVH